MKIVYHPRYEGVYASDPAATNWHIANIQRSPEIYELALMAAGSLA